MYFWLAYFINEILNGQKYVTFLSINLNKLIEKVSLNI